MDVILYSQSEMLSLIRHNLNKDLEEVKEQNILVCLLFAPTVIIVPSTFDVKPLLLVILN